MVKRSRRSFNIFIGILHDDDNSYIEIFARNLPQANFMMEKEYSGNVRYVYRSSKLSGANLKKVKTLDYRDNEKFSFLSSKGDQNKD